MDWTIAPIFGGGTGQAEYKIAPNGLVSWRGMITKTAAYGVGIDFAFPAGTMPLALPIYIGWAIGLNDLNTLVDASGMHGAIYNTPGFVLDMSLISWLAVEPPSPAHTLANVQAGLADALRNIAGLRVYDFPSDRIEPPAAVLSLPETPYDVTLGSRADEWTFPLWVLVAKADDKAAYGEMGAYLEAEGSKSIRAAVEADRTLGGACDTAAVVRARPLFATVAGTEFLAVEFTLEVYT